jgi:hypothetical protein
MLCFPEKIAIRYLIIYATRNLNIVCSGLQEWGMQEGRKQASCRRQKDLLGCNFKKNYVTQ